MRILSFIIILVFTSLAWHCPAVADVQMFAGKLDVVKSSGKACAGRAATYEIFLVLGIDNIQDEVFGYVGGDSVTVGQLRGYLHEALRLRYPYPDAERAEGHSLQISINGTTLAGEMRDRPLEDAANDCNFDLSKISMHRVENQDKALETYHRLAIQYEAQLMKSTAVTLTRQGSHAEAAQAFEKALAFADGIYPKGSPRLMPYLTGLANSYIRAGRYSDFSTFFDSRLHTLHDENVKNIFNNHAIRSLLQEGRNALNIQEYQTALSHFRKALQIDHRNKDVIAAIMSALVRSGQHDEAIAFLEETEQKLDREPDRKDVREAIALVSYRKSKKEQASGRDHEAALLLKKAIKLDPGTAKYLVELARLVHKSGKFKEADTLLKRGVDASKEEAKRAELIEARDRLRQTEMILAKMRKAGN